MTSVPCKQDSEALQPAEGGDGASCDNVTLPLAPLHTRALLLHPAGDERAAAAVAEAGMTFSSAEPPNAAGRTPPQPEEDVRIMSHAMYPDLIRAVVQCRQAISSTNLQEVQRLGQLQESALAAADQAAPSLREQASSSEQDAAELTHFMEGYVGALHSFAAQLDEGMIQAEEMQRAFDKRMATLLSDAIKGNELQSLSSAAPPGTTQQAGGSDNSVPEDVKSKLMELHQEFRKTKRSAKLPDTALAALKGWWEANLKHPYPSDMEKKELMSETGLDATQINNWFINQRKRHWNAQQGE